MSADALAALAAAFLTGFIAGVAFYAIRAWLR